MVGLITGYAGVVCDLDGVVYRGPAAVPHAVPALSGLPLPVVQPRLTMGLIVLTGLVFAGQYLSDSLLGGDLVAAFGAKTNSGLIAGEYWRLITPIFIHANLLHLFVNCYSLYIIGPQVEPEPAGDDVRVTVTREQYDLIEDHAGRPDRGRPA